MGTELNDNLLSTSSVPVDNFLKGDDNIKDYKYSTWFINILSFVISIVFFLFINCVFSYVNFLPKRAVLRAGFTTNITNQYK